MPHTLAASLLLSALLFASGCAQKEKSENTDRAAAGNLENVTQVLSVEKRLNLAPNFSWVDRTGKTVYFDSYRGRITFVNFWATWCGPCRKEIPDLIELSEEFADRGVKILGVSTDRGLSVIKDVQTFVQEHKIPYQIVIDNDELAEAFGNVRMLPTSLIVDAEGKIVQTFIGARSKEAFRQTIAALLE